MAKRKKAKKKSGAKSAFKSLKTGKVRMVTAKQKRAIMARRKRLVRLASKLNRARDVGLI